MFSTDDTIVAIATPPGRGGIGVSSTHQRGDEFAFPVGIRSERKGLLPVARQHVRLPFRHDSYLNRRYGGYGRQRRSDG